METASLPEAMCPIEGASGTNESMVIANENPSIEHMQISEDKPKSQDANTKVNLDPCGTPKDLKLRFQEKLAEIDQGDLKFDPSSWRPATDSDDEDNLVPSDRAPILEKPKIVESTFEEEIAHLLESSPSCLTSHNDAEQREVPDSFEIPAADLYEDPNVLFQFYEPKEDTAMVEELQNLTKMFAKLSHTDFPLATEEDDENLKENEPDSSTRLRVRMSTESQNVSADMDDSTLPPLSSPESNEIIPKFKRKIKTISVSLPSDSPDEPDPVLPTIVSEDGVVLPILATDLDDISASSGVLNDESLSGTIFEESILPDIFEDDESETELPELNPEDEMLLQSEDAMPVCEDEVLPRSSIEKIAERLSAGPKESSVFRVEDPLSVDEVLSSICGGKEEESSEMQDVLDEETRELLKSLGAIPKPGTIPSLPGQRRYDSESVVAWEEDQMREFKGHRNVCDEEIPPWCLIEPRTRSPISRNICGFLNTGMGGTIYLGILNNGTVRGERMTCYQQDHLLLSLRDTLRRFRPPVPQHLVKVSFVPVLQAWDLYPVENSKSTLQPDDTVRRRPHKLRCSEDCWCDLEAAARFKQGIQTRRYVVEICVSPVDPDDPLLSDMKPNSAVRTRPVFQADDAQIYFRKHASSIKCSVRDIEERAKDEVLLYKMPQLLSAWKDYLTYKKLTDAVQEALLQHGDTSLVEKIRDLETQASKSTYRQVQDRLPLYGY